MIASMNIEILSELFRTTYHFEPTEIVSLSGSGSNRRYFRLIAPSFSVIGVIGTNLDENRAFLYLARHFHDKGIPVPEIIAVSDDQMAYLQNDLGSCHLFDIINRTRNADDSFDETTIALMRESLSLLAKVQFLGAECLDFSRCFPLAEMDERTIRWDLNYFKYCFLKATGVDFAEEQLEDDFDSMVETLRKAPSDTFMYRDFQSRNIMLCNNTEPYLIDFQGGRKGPYIYDLVSFLWQAKARIPDATKQSLINHYLDVAGRYADIDTALFRQLLPHFVLFRTLQVLGAYGYRGYFERKPHFIESVPFALENLRQLLNDNSFDRYPHLIPTLRKIVNKILPSTASTAKPALRVRVMSFSYRRGIPDDPSGNGGGFVFDCRAVHNPGRYDRYKQLTGLDLPVIEFLEADGEILRFLSDAYSLVDTSVARYIKRDFTSLMVSFGCTGGRHRSVYSAEHMAEHINRKFGIEVELIHREQNISRILPSHKHE